MFADLDLIGIPHRVVLSERGLAPATPNTRAGATTSRSDLPLRRSWHFLKERLHR